MDTKKGDKSFNDYKTHNGLFYNKYKEVAETIGLIEHNQQIFEIVMKYDLIYSRRCKYLGVILDSKQGSIELTDKRKVSLCPKKIFIVIENDLEDSYFDSLTFILPP